MGAARAGLHLQGQHLRLPPGQDLDLRHQPRADPVADQVGEPLLLIQRVSNAAHVAAAILHPDQQRAAGCVGEGHDRFQRPIRRGKITLDLQRLALRALEQVEQVRIARKCTPKRSVLSLIQAGFLVRGVGVSPTPALTCRRI